MGDCQDPGAYISMLWYKMGDCQDPGAYISMLWYKMGDCQDPGAYITMLWYKTAQLSDQDQILSPPLSGTAVEVVTANNYFQRQGGSQKYDDSCSDSYQAESDNNYEFNDIDSEYDRFSDSNDSDDSHQDNEDEDCNQKQVPNLAADLAGWATTNKCTRSSLDELLDILRQQGLRLPKDSRTLLQTPRSITTLKKCGGDYLYLGLESGLVKQFQPFVDAVYCGDTKPNSVDEYLFDFLSEITDLQHNGINKHDAEIGQLKVLFSAFIWDAPARSFLKCTKSHNEYFSCERCVIKRRWCQRRVIYDIGENLQPVRTEQYFKNFEYKDHQIKQTPLIDAVVRDGKELKKKKRSRAVSKEGDQEEEGVVPSIWITEDGLMWPREINAIRAMKELHVRHPDEKWGCFELIKVKLTSEVSDDEGEDSEIGKRKQKKKTEDEHVTDANVLQEMAETGNTQVKVASGTTKKKVAQQTKFGDNQRKLPDPPAPAPSASQSTSSDYSKMFWFVLDKRYQSFVLDSQTPSTSGIAKKLHDNATRKRRNTKFPSPSLLRERSSATGLDHLHGARDPDPPDIRGQDPDPPDIRGQDPDPPDFRGQDPDPPDIRGQDPDPPDIWGHNHFQYVPIQGLLQEIEVIHQDPLIAIDTSKGLLSKNQEMGNIRLNKRGKLILKDQKELLFSPCRYQKIFQRRMLYLLTDIRDLLKKDYIRGQQEYSFKQINEIDVLKEQDIKLGEEKEFALCVSKVYKMCLTNKLMSTMDMRGKKNKQAFGDSNLFKIIRDAVLASHTEATESKIIEQCSKYLKYAPWREGGENIGNEVFKKRKEELKRKIDLVMGNQSKYHHLRKIFWLSNMTDPIEEFSKLQQSISEAARKMGNWGQYMPLKWILLEHLIAINKEDGKDFINFTEMLRLAKHHNINIQDSGEVLLFLRFQHEEGNIIFFEEIKDFIILNPKWLVNAFRCLVSDKIDDTIQHCTDSTMFQQNGIISSWLITERFKSKLENEFLEQKESLLEVMEKFDILLKIGEKGQYIMPSMMPFVSPNDVWEKIGIEKDNCKRTSWLCLKFSFLPPAFFNHFTLWFIRKYTVESERKSLKLFRGICLFNIDESQCEKLLVIMSADTIALQLLSFSIRRKEFGGMCSNIRKDLLKETEAIKQRYKLKIFYELHFKCDTGHYSEDTKSYQDLKKIPEYYCVEHKQSHQSEKILLPWMMNADEEEATQHIEQDEQISRITAVFKRELENKTVMEGAEVTFECEADNPNPVIWYKKGSEISPSSNVKIEALYGRVHKLTILQTTLEDEGRYEIKIKDTFSGAILEVNEMPDAVKQMSEHDRNNFLKAVQSGTAVRYYIRIMIVGESGVGKTCLLRRLMNEQICDVRCTDGINIERKQCKINRQTEEWIFTSDEEFSKTAYQNEEFADCEFWDFAGQKEFYATHQTFLSTNAIYLLVADISKYFQGKTFFHMIEDAFDNARGN
ncbi:unnamed protein product [Mytilus coruscus]|uniref:Immunoglobulin domain-containing protein n=1 Tax=Mytilus coruscus TaxID=42192 RepID=A0A6J8AM71_MYTCO|nr:unnamed protein product [Mytilus coruscus]